MAGGARKPFLLRLPPELWKELEKWAADYLRSVCKQLEIPVHDTYGAGKLLLGYMTIADAQLAGREWFFSHFTSADAYFFWCFKRGGELGVNQKAYPNCNAHFTRLHSRPSVAKALAFEKETMAGFAKAA